MSTFIEKCLEPMSENDWREFAYLASLSHPEDLSFIDDVTLDIALAVNAELEAAQRAIRCFELQRGD